MQCDHERYSNLENQDSIGGEEALDRPHQIDQSAMSVFVFAISLF